MHISMDTLERVCETLNWGIIDVIELTPDEPAFAGGKEHERIETKITENGIDYILVRDYYIPDLKLPQENCPIGKYGRMHREYL